MRNESRLSTFGHYLVTIFSLLVLGWAMTFFLGQMGLKLAEKQDMNELIPSLMWVCPLVFAFGTQLYYLINKKGLVQFISDWSQFEVDLIKSLPGYKEQHERSHKIYSVVCRTQLVMQCFLLILFICLLILPETTTEQQHDFWTLPNNASSSRQLFMMHHPQLCRAVHPLFFVLIHIVSMMFAAVFVPLADLVPSFVYSHAATAIHALADAIQQNESISMKGPKDDRQEPPSVKIESDLHHIFSLYEQIRAMVKRADDLFGPIVIFNHGLTFFMIVTFGFSLIFWKEALAYNVVMQVVVFVAYIIRIVISLKLMGRLHSSADPL